MVKAYISDWIVNKMKEKLQTKFKLPAKEIKGIEDLLLSEFLLHEPVTSLPSVCRDADDNNILQLAESAETDYIVTGDKDLLVLRKYKSIIIVTPSKFMELIR